MKLNEIRDNPGATKARKRVGRGIASGTGKTCGRGHKGQHSRSGVSILGFEGGQTPIQRRMPKRGFVSRVQNDFALVNLGSLQKAIDSKLIDAAQPIDAEVLNKVGIIRDTRLPVKLLAKGTLSHAVTLKVAKASASAKNAIEEAKGTVEIV